MTEVSETPKDYKEIAKDPIDSLSMEIDYPDSLMFGPTYQVDSEKGTFNIFSVFLKSRGELVLICTGDNSTTYGIKHTKLTDKGQPEITAEGMVVTRVRDAGAAVLLELAHSDFLQRFADFKQKPVIWKISNANQRELEILKSRSANADIIQAKEEEQKRWQHIYGPEGILGISENLTRTFNPESSLASLESFDTVTITRRGKTIQKQAIHAGNIIRSHEQKLFQLRSMLPQLKADIK